VGNSAAIAGCVVSSVSADEPVLRREIVERAMAARGNRALFLMDLGVPRNIDPSVAELYNVYVYNTDDLSEIVQQNRNARESEVPRLRASSTSMSLNSFLAGERRAGRAC